MKSLLTLLLVLFAFVLDAQTLDFASTYHSIGVKVTNIANADSCKIAYKKATQSNWLDAFKPDKITIAGIEQFRGSLFLLEENTKYDVRVTIYTGTSAKVLPVAQHATRISPNFVQTNNVKWVSANGNGNYTQANPGNLTTLFSSGQISCGTTIMLTHGVYAVSNGLSLTLNTNCTENTPIIMMAAPGATPIIEGKVTISTPWTPHPNDPNLYSTPMPSAAAHSNICVMGNTALYPYPSLNAEALLGGYHLTTLNFGYDGFVRDENRIWIKTRNNINPNNEVVNVCKASRFLTVYGNNKNAFLKIKGIEFRYFGKPVLNNLGSSQDSYSANVFDFRNVHHIYFDHCRFLYNTNHISFYDQCDNYTIQNCYFKHDVGKWTHAMIKKSYFYVHTLFGTISSSRGRYIETPAILLHIGKQGVIRNNYFDGLNSGIEGYFMTGMNEEIDIYNNIFIDNFDAIECDGLWSNLRVWNNEIIRPMAGISAAPPTIGPRYFYRNTFHGMKGRRNEKDDPHFIGCKPINSNYMGQGVGIKTNSGYQGDLPSGNLYFFNNTFHAEDSLGFVFTSWESEWRKILFINNAYSHLSTQPFFYINLADKTTNSDFQLTSIRDNYYNFKPTSPLAVAKHIHGQFTCTSVPNLNSLQTTLTSISGSPNILIQNPTQHNPSFSNMYIGGFGLNRNSPMIDAGIIIPGFYDYKGAKPDIGSKESEFTVSSYENEAEASPISIYPNPTSTHLTIKVSDDIGREGSLKIYDVLGNIVIISNLYNTKNQTINIENLANGLYFIEIEFQNIKSVYKIVKN